jgi:hypothetical protein
MDDVRQGVSGSYRERKEALKDSDSIYMHTHASRELDILVQR